MAKYINLYDELNEQKNKGKLKHKRLYNAINANDISFVQDNNVFWCETSQYIQMPYYDIVIKQAKQYLKQTRNLKYYLED